ncbi:hypothetical protein GOP47_0025288 [Adiantum capillus-veneris]|uniref:Uncharacterized protein n=1 Tax=Adiantum capillus-veneris TaxID=13818 RepID=A0A9D4U085_ADICA|nr:hypothetical protein GOP47_0025288 [Adiantum capillus-veneris]
MIFVYKIPIDAEFSFFFLALSRDSPPPSKWIIRDIGFVISSPPILEDSEELPTVDPDVLGGGIKTWSDSINWLASLDVDQVKQWFEVKSNNGRLGEHFAFCVEYVLLFSPFSQARNLMTFMQVTSRTGELGSFGKEKHLAVSIKVEKGHVLIESNSTKTAEMGISETSVQSLVDPMEDIMDPQELMAQRACEPEKLEIFLSDTLTINEQRQGKHEKIGKRKRKLLRKMQRLRQGKGVTVTIGEFDFLFEDAIDHDEISFQPGTERERSYQAHQEVKVNHWEASVKFLLYSGPWEIFGFETPNNGAWHSLNQECEEVGCQPDMGFPYKSRWHANMFLDCFLGPHVGETLYNRKTRLINQLALSQNVHAASLLYKCFGLRSDAEAISSFSANRCNADLDESLGTTGRCTDKAIERQHGEALRIFPRAFLKGYLFYEYELWRQLYPEVAVGQQVLNSKAVNRDCDLRYAARVSPKHWMGWWTRACNFTNFVRLPVHEHSKWYIVPKLEWLSPVVIDGEDEIRNQRVLSSDEFFIVAEKVAEEAERTNISRKRRFMVAEVVWEPLNATHCEIDQAVCWQCDGSPKECGRWTEVSRGFVVEDTWPDSRLYRPLGYRLPLLP